ncbi:unnamed protein product [Gadus morhua 'NCC']
MRVRNTHDVIVSGRKKSHKDVPPTPLSPPTHMMVLKCDLVSSVEEFLSVCVSVFERVCVCPCVCLCVCMHTRTCICIYRHKRHKGMCLGSGVGLSQDHD